MNNHQGITRENLLFLFPQALAGDESLSALADAAAQLLANRIPETDLPRFFPTLDRQEEPVLDILAKDLKVDWYDYDYPIGVKRLLIQGSVLTHRRLGTVYAVKSALCSLYPDSRIEEWFDYGGENGRFRITVNVTGNEKGNALQAYSAEVIRRNIEPVKRLAAHLESINFRHESSGAVRIGAYTAAGTRLEIWPELTAKMEIAGNAGTGGAAAAWQTVDVYPELASRIEVIGKAGEGGITAVRQAVEIYPEA